MPIIEVLPVEDQIGAIESFLPEYAEMQRTTADLATRWTQAGVPNRRIAGLAEQFEVVQAGLALDRVLTARCATGLTALRQVCDELGHRGPPDVLDHADIHAWNVLTGAGGARLILWGDCCVTHPFTSLCVPALFVVEQLPDADRPAAARLRVWLAGGTPCWR